jgi:hypothetical protein
VVLKRCSGWEGFVHWPRENLKNGKNRQGSTSEAAEKGWFGSDIPKKHPSAAKAALIPLPQHGG